MGPEIRIVGRLHGTWPMQSVNKYTDKDYRMKENCQSQDSKRWESGGGRGAARDRHSASQPTSPFHLSLGYSCASHIHLETHPLPYHTPLPLTLTLFFGGGHHNLQFSTKSMNSRHLILHPRNLGLGPLHVLAKFKIAAPGEEQGKWDYGYGVGGWREEE